MYISVAFEAASGSRDIHVRHQAPAWKSLFTTTSSGESLRDGGVCGSSRMTRRRRQDTNFRRPDEGAAEKLLYSCQEAL